MIKNDEAMEARKNKTKIRFWQKNIPTLSIE